MVHRLIEPDRQSRTPVGQDITVGGPEPGDPRDGSCLDRHRRQADGLAVAIPQARRQRDGEDRLGRQRTARHEDSPPDALARRRRGLLDRGHRDMAGHGRLDDDRSGEDERIDVAIDRDRELRVRPDDLRRAGGVVVHRQPRRRCGPGEERDSCRGREGAAVDTVGGPADREDVVGPGAPGAGRGDRHVGPARIPRQADPGGRLDRERRLDRGGIHRAAERDDGRRVERLTGPDGGRECGRWHGRRRHRGRAGRRSLGRRDRDCRDDAADRDRQPDEDARRVPTREGAGSTGVAEVVRGGRAGRGVAICQCGSGSWLVAGGRWRRGPSAHCAVRHPSRPGSRKRRSG